MANTKTAIEWTDATWNPTTGCTKVSPGCAHCYAERITIRFGGKAFLPGVAEVIEHPDRLAVPLHWKKPRRIFVNSMSDLFHPDVSDGFRKAVFDVMEAANWHTFQVLTKRPEEMYDWLLDNGYYQHYMPPNVWLGVSVENARWTSRIGILRDCEASVRFLSVEPLLGSVGKLDLDGIHWVIVGGESGPKARPMNPEWAREVRDQCVAAGVPFFFKQAGAKVGHGSDLLDGQNWKEFPESRE